MAVINLTIPHAKVNVIPAPIVFLFRYLKDNLDIAKNLYVPVLIYVMIVY